MGSAENDATAGATDYAKGPVVESASLGFEIFYRAEVTRLVAFLLYLGASPKTAIQLAQQVMRQTYANWSVVGEPRRWTRRVASRSLIRILTEATFDEAAVDEDAPHLATTGARAPDWVELRSEYIGAVQALPPRERQIFAWSLDGWSPPEIAAELGMGVDVVEELADRARQTVAHAWDSRGVSE